MDEALGHKLVDLTRDFYARNAVSFSETRRAPWSGWYRVLEEVDLIGAVDHDVYRIADIGCGNLRFERMVIDKLDETAKGSARCPGLEFVCVDDNAAFLEEAESLRAHVGSRPSIETIRADIMDDLGFNTAGALSSITGCDLVVCFAVMHHIPLASWREGLLDHLVGMTKPGGHIALSFWRFSRDDRLLEKAHAATDAAEEKLGIRLDHAAGDYLMGWRDEPDLWRYCHDFTDDDINGMVRSRIGRCGDVVEVARFSADGRNGNLNEYVVLQKR